MALIAGGMGIAALGGYLLKYFTSENARKKDNSDEIKESQINNVIVKESVAVDNHIFLIIGIFMILAILVLFCIAISFKTCRDAMKRRYSRRPQTPIRTSNI